MFQHTALSPQKRALVVEDSLVCARLLELVLSQRKCRITSVDTVGGALQALKEHTFEIVVCDLWLPDGNGTEIGRVLRDKFPSVFAIAVTAQVPGKAEEEAARCGFAAFLQKPFRVTALTNMLDDAGFV